MFSPYLSIYLICDYQLEFSQTVENLITFKKTYKYSGSLETEDEDEDRSLISL